MTGFKITRPFLSVRPWFLPFYGKQLYGVAIFLIIAGCSPVHEQPHRIVNGVLDLSSWNLKSEGVIDLKGDWEFYWKKLLVPSDFTRPSALKPDGFMPTPGIWNDALIKDKKLSGKGFGTYRLLIKTRPTDGAEKRNIGHHSNSELTEYSELQTGLLIQYVETAYSIFVNGVRIGGAGQVGQSAKSSIPSYKPQLLRLPVSGGPIEVILQVSNFHHLKGGIDYAIHFGEYSQLLRKQKREIATDLFIFSSILIMGLYHFGLFITRRKDRSTLYFGIFCLSIALRTLVTNDCQLLMFFPHIGYRQLLILEYASFTIPLPSIILFFNSLFPKDVNRTVMRVIVGISTGYMVFVLVTPTIIFSASVIPFQILILFSAVYLSLSLINAIRNKRPESIIAMVGAVILLVASINDILYNNLIIHTAIMVQFGVLGMILVQAFLLSVRFSKALSEVEILKISLEYKVNERTTDLKQALERINQQSQEQKELLHILCHDLANPFISLSSLLNLAEEDMSVFEELSKLMQISVNSGLDTIDLVRQMRVLEDKSDTLKIQKENLLLLVSESLSILDKKMSDKRITSITDIDATHHVQVERSSFVNSVLNNVLSNAIKFSMPGEKIIVRSTKENDTITLIVQDFGIGMSPTLLSNLFDFSKTTSRLGTKGEKGTGFGMPLVKKFIEAYQGVLEIETSDQQDNPTDHGTKIAIRLKSG